MQSLLAVPSVLLASKETWMTSFSWFCTFYEDSLPSPLSLDAEMTLWQRKWERQDPNAVPTTALVTLKEIDQLRCIPTSPSASKYLSPYQSPHASVREMCQL